MPNDDLTNWLQRMGEKHGLDRGATCEPVRPAEVISGASGVQTSTGEVSYETLEEGGDFGTGVRDNALSNDHDQNGSHYAEGANPMQSANLGSGTFALRYGIGFLCADYQGNDGDLADIAELSKPKSAYLAAFRGMDKTRQYKDPTVSTMRSKLAWWIKHLSKQLGECEQGELVVSFQGHGQNGAIYGVKYGKIGPGEMVSISRKAAERRVSLTWVLDACFSGNAVPAFQDSAADSVDSRIDASEGAGNVCSQENYDRAEELRDRMPHVRQLVQMNEAIGRLTHALQRTTDRLEGENSEDAWNEAIRINGKIVEYLGGIQTQFRHNMDFGRTHGMGLDQVDRSIDETVAFLNGIEPFTCFDYDVWTSRIGRLQDRISDAANEILGQIDRELAAIGT